MWDWLVWGALAVAIVAGIAAATWLGIETYRFIRELKRSRGQLFKQLDDLGEAATAVGERAADAGAGTERLTRSLERLAASRRRLAVLQEAIDEVIEPFRWLAVLFPRK